MSEDVKPRKLFMLYDDRGYYDTLAFESLEKFNNFENEMSELEERKKFKSIPFIELEPTMRLMAELAETFQEWLDDTEDDFSEQPGWKSCKETLEKYKKFKEGLK